MPQRSPDNLREIELLIGLLGSPQVDRRLVIPALQSLIATAPETGGLAQLIETLRNRNDEATSALVEHLTDIRFRDAFAFHQMAVSGFRSVAEAKFQTMLGDLPLDAPPRWEPLTSQLDVLDEAVAITGDVLFLRSIGADRYPIAAVVERKYIELLPQAAAVLGAVGGIIDERLLDGLPSRDTESKLGIAEPLLIDLKSHLHRYRREMMRHANEALSVEPVQLPESGVDDLILLQEIETHYCQAAPSNKRRFLDLLCAWPTVRAIPFIERVATTPWAQERAALVFTVRFGERFNADWRQWQNQLRRQQWMIERLERTVLDLVARHATELVWLWMHELAELNPDTKIELEKYCLASISTCTNPKDFVARWSNQLTVDEEFRLVNWSSQETLSTASMVEPSPIPTGEVDARDHVSIATHISDIAQERTPDLASPTPLICRETGMDVSPRRPSSGDDAYLHGRFGEASLPTTTTPRAITPTQPKAPRPSFWQQHLQPLLMENWYIVAGVAMVLVGASLCTYYTWDKAWYWRYTLAPLLLGGFTWALAGVGAWIERHGDEFLGTGAILRGAAIGLLPVNFMAVTVLANDDQVAHKTLAIFTMALIYLVVFGWGLLRWCAAIAPVLRWILGGTLLALNFLVTLGPIAVTVSAARNQDLRLLLGIGFHLGFALVVMAVLVFSQNVLTREMAAKQRVPWFFGGTLTLTFAQVFIWVHSYLRSLPHPYTYAPMVIIIGWLIFVTERRALTLRGDAPNVQAVSFLGFAFVLLGIIMGFGEPTMRICAFLLGGSAWLYQAWGRGDPLQYWLSLTLLILAGAAVSLLPGFPDGWQPAIGATLAILLGLGYRRIRGLGEIGLAKTCLGMQAAVLVLTAVVAPLSQWHFHSPPPLTAVFLIYVVGHFLWCAFRDQQLRWVHTAMLVAALALPYVGFVNLDKQSLHGNTMVFGVGSLALIWIAVVAWIKHPLLVQARSTVLWLYGVLAVTAMMLRVILERNAPFDPYWYLRFMDYSGPALMTVALVFATYYSRSWISAGMAMIILVVLFPELKQNLQNSFANRVWGTGLGSACWSLGLAGLGFALRRWRFLENLSEGDRFLGKYPFPWCRHDHSLFSWPVMVSAIFLAVKVDTYNLYNNLADAGVKTASALVITGVTWTLVAIYGRRREWATGMVRLGWWWLFAGVVFWHRFVAEEFHWSVPLLITALILQGLWFLYRFYVARRFDWATALLLNPLHDLLQVGCLWVAVLCGAALVIGQPLLQMQWLLVVLAAHLWWHGLTTRKNVYGLAFFLLAWLSLLAGTAPGDRLLTQRLSFPQSLIPTLGLLLAAHLMPFLLERWTAAYEFLRPMLASSLHCATGIAMAIGLMTMANLHGVRVYTDQQIILLIVAVFMSARAQRSGYLLVIGYGLTYVLINLGQLRQLPDTDACWTLLTDPRRVALLSLAIALITHGGRLVHRIAPGILIGPYGHKFFRATHWAWIYTPALSLAAWAGLAHTVSPELRDQSAYVWIPFVSAATFGCVAWFWRLTAGFGGAGLFIMLGNIHLVRVFCGAELLRHGLSEIHLVCIGLAVTMIEATIIRRTLPQRQATAIIRQFCLGLAGLILGLLAVNYFTHPNLESISSVRFLSSGLLALLASLYFRHTARDPDPDLSQERPVCEALYHAGVTLAIWCAALIIPPLRSPALAFLALGLPVVYFYLRAELGRDANHSGYERYRDSATILGFLMLGLYIFRGVFHMILFPEAVIDTTHYHVNAPLVMLLSLGLIRLRGLGGTDWLAFYGVLALMTGSYFALTWIEPLSPFRYPLAGSWCAVGLGHFWILVGARRSPLRTALQRLAGLDQAVWSEFSHTWGNCLLAAVHVLAMLAVSHRATDSYRVAPLMIGVASMVLHQGVARRLPWLLVIAGLEIVAALHADFILPSYLPKEQVVWVVLAAWFIAFVVHEIKPEFLDQVTLTKLAEGLALITFLHILHHHPGSTTGWWAFLVTAALASCHPQSGYEAESTEQIVMAVLLLWSLVWLVYFHQAPLAGVAWSGLFDVWRILTTTSAVLAVGGFARWYQRDLATNWHAWRKGQPRLVDVSLTWMEQSGADIQTATLWTGFGMAALIQFFHYHHAFAPRELALLCTIYVALATGWYYAGRRLDSSTPYYLMQLSFLALFAVVRRQLLLTTDFWNYEYDVWVGLAVSSCLAGAKDYWNLQARTMRVPLLTSMIVLPIAAFVWVLIHHLGTNLALLVTGIYSVMFAYLGRTERESPYNVVAIFGFVGFVLLWFWSKQEWRYVHAYVIPVGLGILALLQLFGHRVAADTRNQVRFITLAAMMGSTGWYALADDRHEVAFNLTLILLSLAAMGVGSLLRARLYVIMGFFGLMVDLLATAYKVVRQMERSTQMTTIGSLVLIAGIGLVFGAIYYKTHRDSWNSYLTRWQQRIGVWE